MELGEYAIKKALALGMDEAEVYTSKIKNIYIQFASEIQNIKTTESVGLSIRVVKGKQLAMQASTILTKKEIDNIVEKVVKIAKVTPEDPNWKHFNKKFAKKEVSGIYDEKIADFNYEKITDRIIGGINKASENDRKAMVTRGVYSATIGNAEIINNYNENIGCEYTLNYGVMSSKAIEGGDSSGSESHVSRNWDGLNFDDLAEKSANKALKYIGSKPTVNMSVPIIMKNKLFANIIGIMLGYNISAENIQKGRSTFATKINQQIASEDISLIDDGTKSHGAFTRPFDSDGNPTQKTEVISKGILKNILYDNYTANIANTKSTGNANRDYWRIPTPDINNLFLKPGKTSLEDMIRDTKKGLYVENTIGEWLSNPTNGDLNATVTHGFLIENGELTRPVTNVVLEGNIFDILINKIEVLGNDVVNEYNIYSPSIKISKMNVAGK